MNEYLLKLEIHKFAFVCFEDSLGIFLKYKIILKEEIFPTDASCKNKKKLYLYSETQEFILFLNTYIQRSREQRMYRL